MGERLNYFLNFIYSYRLVIFAIALTSLVPLQASAFDEECDIWIVSGAGRSASDGTYEYDAAATAANQVLFSNSYLSYSDGDDMLTITGYGRELLPEPYQAGVGYYYASVSGFQSGDFSGIDSVNAQGTNPAPEIDYDGSGCEEEPPVGGGIFPSNLGNPTYGVFAILFTGFLLFVLLMFVAMVSLWVIALAIIPPMSMFFRAFLGLLRK